MAKDAELDRLKVAGDIYENRAKAPAVEGKANKRVIEVLAKHFAAAKSQVKLVTGVTSRYKVFEISIIATL